MTDISGQQQHQSTTKRGFVKQVISGDAVILQGPAQNGPPKEVTVYLANINAPRLAKRPVDDSDGSPDEPYAWEAREFLRKKIVGQTVVFVRDFLSTSNREHGRIYLGGTNITNAENISETGVAEGIYEVKPGKQIDENTQKLLDLQEQAKASKKGRWSEDDPSNHVRNVKWTIEDPRSFVAHHKQAQIDAIVEQVRDGSTLRLFLLPSFEYVTVMLSGVKSPSVRSGPEGKAEEFGEEAKFFVESRILQRDVKVVLESTSNQNFIGSVIHPKGNIAEFLLKDGYAKVVEWSLASATCGPLKLREAEKYAKERRVRLWKNFLGAPTQDRKSYSAKVVEIGLGDSINVIKDNDEEVTKIYFSSLRPPRRDNAGGEGQAARQFRPLYDIPFMFENREFLRKRLLGKRVNIVVDYIQPKSEQFPEKICCSVSSNNQDVSELLVSKGLAKVVRHRQDDDGRSSRYDALLAAEAQAEKDKRGMWADKSENTGLIRVQELQGDAQRSKQFLPYLQRSSRPEGIVEFVSSGSRLRVYVPKETCLITFLLAGISCPRGARIGPGGKSIGESEPGADEALAFTKSKCLQHDVQIEVESVDKAGGYVGYLYVQNERGTYVNMAECLLENGLALVHFTAERSPYFNQLVAAEKIAKKSQIGIWKGYVENHGENEKQKQVADVGERKINCKKIVVTEVYPDLHFAAQVYDDGSAIEKLMGNLQNELNSGTTTATLLKRGQLVAARYKIGNLWHRVRVESIRGNDAEVYYIDFGNRESMKTSELAVLPMQFHSQPAGAREFQLALVASPKDEHYAKDTREAFEAMCFSYPHFFLNVEYKVGNLDSVTLYAEQPEDGLTNEHNINKKLVQDGVALVEKRGESRFHSLIYEYVEAEKEARKNRRNIWQYGDFTGDEI